MYAKTKMTLKKIPTMKPNENNIIIITLSLYLHSYYKLELEECYNIIIILLVLGRFEKR